MAGRSVACVDRKVLHTHKQTHIKVEYMQIHTTHTLPRVSSAYMHGCFCLFTSDNSCPAYAALLCMCYDSSFGGMVCHFLSSVHRTSVITAARARLFYRTSYEGRSDDCTLLLSARSIFSQSLFHCFLPSLPLLYSLFSLSDWHTQSLSLISHTRIQFSLPITGRDNESDSWKRTVWITIDLFFFFLTRVPSHWTWIGCAAARLIGKIFAFNGITLLEEAKPLMCVLPCRLTERENTFSYCWASIITTDLERRQRVA